jgi:hypothetical protein
MRIEPLHKVKKQLLQLEEEKCPFKELLEFNNSTYIFWLDNYDLKKISEYQSINWCVLLQ